eukprot:2093097-Rhodomonas_salina.2
MCIRDRDTRGRMGPGPRAAATLRRQRSAGCCSPTPRTQTTAAQAEQTPPNASAPQNKSRWASTSGGGIAPSTEAPPPEMATSPPGMAVLPP